MNITSEQLRVLVAVANCGSFSRAAGLLGQTPSSISRKVGGLEKQLDIQLFTRTTRRLGLTEEGGEVLEKARQVMRIIEDIEDSSNRQQQAPQGRLKVDASSPFLEQCLIPHVAEYLRAYPKVEIEFACFDHLVGLLEKQIDVAFRIGELRDSSLHYRPIGRSKLRILASPDYVKRYGVPDKPEELRDHRCLGFSQPINLNKWPLINGKKDFFEVAPGLSASSGSALRQLALNGVGIVCLAGFMTHDDLSQGRLVPVLEGYLVEKYQPINAVFYRDYQSSLKLKTFVDFVSSAIAYRLG